MIAGSGTRFPAQRLRHIFVAERRSRTAVEGPDDAGAAMIMGHSVRQWDLTYDRNFELTQAQAAVDAMAQWRANVLAAPKAGPVQAPPSLAQLEIAGTAPRQPADSPGPPQQRQQQPVVGSSDLAIELSDDEEDIVVEL